MIHISPVSICINIMFKYLYKYLQNVCFDICINYPRKRIQTQLPHRKRFQQLKLDENTQNETFSIFTI